MSAVDRMIERRSKVAYSERPRTDFDRKLLASGSDEAAGLARTHVPWWPARYADLIERRRTGEVRARRDVEPFPALPESERLPRPEGMTRQTHRRLCRETAKLARLVHGAQHRARQRAPRAE